MRTATPKDPKKNLLTFPQKIEQKREASQGEKRGAVAVGLIPF